MMNGLVLDFFKISPRNTSLETLKVDTEFGYSVTPIAKYPLTRVFQYQMADLWYQRNRLVFCKFEIFQDTTKK